MAEPSVSDLYQEDGQTSPPVALPEINNGIIATVSSQPPEEVHLSKIYYQNNGRQYEPHLGIGSNTDACSLTAAEFEANPFRFNADDLVFLDDCRKVVVQKILDCLSGWGTVKKLDFMTSRIAEDVDPILFNRMVQELKSTEVRVLSLPSAYWQLPGVKQMTSIRSRNFPMPLAYLTEMKFEYLAIACEGSSTDTAQFNAIMKKWAKGDLEIKQWDICGPSPDEDQIFAGFYMASEDKSKNWRRPLVVPFEDYRVLTDWMVVRADGKRLFMKYKYYDHERNYVLMIHDTQILRNWQRQN